VDQTRWLEDLYTGNADRRPEDAAERMALLAYHSRRAEGLRIADLFGLA
jgi:hypothetical protein